MTIEIHQPELEALIRQRMQTGRFKSVEDVLLNALNHDPEPRPTPESPTASSMEQMFAKVRGLFTEEELEFRRDPAPGRVVDLS